MLWVSRPVFMGRQSSVTTGQHNFINSRAVSRCCNAVIRLPCCVCGGRVACARVRVA